MTKRGLLVLIVVVVLLGGAIALFIVMRPQVPQRDYFAEYKALVVSQWGRLAGDAGAAEAAWLGLVALDRPGRIERIVNDVIDETERALLAEGLVPVIHNRVSMVHAIQNPRYAYPEFHDEAAHALDLRLIELARPIAEERVRLLHERPEIRRAIAAAIEHDIAIFEPIPAPTLYEMPFPILNTARQNALADAMMIRISGDDGQRFEAFRLGLLSARIGSTPSQLFGGLMMVTCEGVALNATLDAFFDARDGRVAPLDARRWLEALRAHAAMRPSNRWFMESERLVALDMIDAEYRQRPNTTRMGTLTTVPVIGASHARVHGLLDAYYERMVETVGKPLRERDDEQVINSDLFVDQLSWQTRPLLEMLIPALHRAMRRFDEGEALLGGTMAALALAAYRADHGAWPATLDELVPEYLDAVPMDPFSAVSGSPLVYRIGADGSPMLYSVSPNQNDDGGTWAKDERTLRERGDIVILPRHE